MGVCEWQEFSLGVYLRVDSSLLVGYTIHMGSKTDVKTLVGKTFTRLTILEVVEIKPRIIKGRKLGYKYGVRCQCTCGKTKLVNYTDLTTRHTHSCGCLASENTAKRNYKHGESSRGKKSKEYMTWISMLGRCYEKTNSTYCKYGARGITVCERWRDKERGYINFLKDMGRKPTPKHSIDRIDGAKNYYPGNCRWATSLQQANNQKSNIKVEWGGKVYNLSQLMRHLGIYTKSGVYYSRIMRGWSVEDAFTRPIAYKK